MTERYGFSFGEDDPASRRGPGVTGQRGDEEPESPQRADVREIDLAEEDEDERDLAEAEAAERVERLREADREERDGQATALFPRVEDDAEEAEGGDGGAAAAGAGRVVLQADATPALRSGALLATDAEAVRRQFLDIQAGFVDEPRQAVEQAGELVEALHQKVLESLHAEREQLDDALAGEEPSTEDLRVALRAYRAYVDRLLGLHL